MAKLFGEIAAKSILTLDKAFARANGQPLDSSELYYSLQAAKDYAKTDIAYIGQKIVVIENNKVTHYSIEDAAGNLKEVGSKPVGDEKSIVVAENGTVSLKGVATLTFERDILDEEGQPTGKKESVQYQPLMTKDGLIWVEPSKTTVEGLATLIDALDKRVVTLEGKVKTLEEKEDKDTTYSVKEGEKILSLNGTEFATSLKIDYSNNEIRLLGINDVEISKFDASAFVADGVLEDASYDADTQELIFTWNIVTGEDEEGNPIYKTDRVNIGDLVDTYTAGNGITITDNLVSVKLTENEKYLEVNETGLHTKGIDEAIENAVKDLPTEDTNTTYELSGNGVTLTLTPSEGEADVVTLDAYTKSETDNKIDEKIASVTGGESAADVKLALESYRDALNKEVWGDDAGSWTTSTTEDGKTKVTYTPNYGAESRIDKVENKLKNIEENADVNIIETVKVNGAALTPDSTKAVDISVPVKVSELTDDRGLLTNVRMKEKTVDGEGATTYEPWLSIAIGADSSVRVIDDSTIQAIVNETKATADSAIQSATIAGVNLTKEGTKLSLSKDALLEALAIDTGVHSVQIASGDADKTIKLTVDGEPTEVEVKNIYSKSEIDTALGNRGDKDIVTLINEAKYDDTKIKEDILANSNAISTLIGTVEGDDTKSVRTIANEEVLKIVDGAPEALNTLKEIADWINDDEAGAAKLAADVVVNTNAIAAINNETTGILAQAKDYTDVEIAKVYTQEFILNGGSASTNLWTEATAE